MFLDFQLTSKRKILIFLYKVKLRAAFIFFNLGFAQPYKIHYVFFTKKTYTFIRKRWIYMSSIWNSDPITKNSYCSRSNLSVIGKKTYKFQHEIWTFWHFFNVSYEKQMQVILLYRIRNIIKSDWRVISYERD